VSPFTFLPRGRIRPWRRTSPRLPSPESGPQLCGDAHLSNFGGLRLTGRRDLLFDLNDFDETLPGPWEWDVKRLATSLEVGRAADNGLYGQAAATTSSSSRFARTATRCTDSRG